MAVNTFVDTAFLIFTGAALLATLALYARQALPVAYIALGVLLGPWMTGWVSHPHVIDQFAHVGIMFLLFLLGLNLHPQRLVEMLREATVVTVVSALLSALLGVAVAWVFGYRPAEMLVVGAAVMFSSTILGLKLMPTSVLHHRHTGGVIISILLLQDLIAIGVLLLLEGMGSEGVDLRRVVELILALPILGGAAYLAQRFVLLPLFRRFDQIQEYIFLVSIGWCLGMAELAAYGGLSHEIGSFFAGVAIATSPISLFIAESLKPLRDFFLVMFFVSLGASFDLTALPQVWLAGLCLATLVLLLKPVVFSLLLRRVGESGDVPREIGIRLGQASEFSLLIAFLAVESDVIGEQAGYLIQFTTIITFIGSAYWIVLRYPTPIAVSDKLRRD
ncbi:MAG: cation:proton antiporter [Chromatiales bacterium]|nr:cation:proton antiporter [Chromatiales bacterium]